MENKDFFRYTKAERIYHQEMCTTRNIKDVLQTKEKIIADGSLGLHKGMDNIMDCNHMGKYKGFFLVY